jgi:glycosyltransferase involved in cell wall biosynthesis
MTDRRSSKRIAIVLQTPNDQHSSVYQTYKALSQEMTRRGHLVSIVTPKDVPGARRFSGRWTPIAYPLAVRQWIRRQSSTVDLVVFHSYAGWLAMAHGAMSPIRTAVAFHGLEPIYHSELVAQAGGDLSWRYRTLQERLMPFFLRTACRNADLVTCLNRGEVDFLLQRAWVDEKRLATVAHGVNDMFFLAERPQRPLRSLLFVAQWLPMKGTDTLHRSFTALARRHPDLELTCAGTLAGAADVLSSFPDDVRGRVKVLPRVDRDQLARLYAHADAFVFPSSYEGFGVALVEAMAARLPIVSTPVGVALDALRDGDSALIIPKHDPNALAAAVERLIADDGLRRKVGEGAYTRAHAYRENDRLREWADTLIGDN